MIDIENQRSEHIDRFEKVKFAISTLATKLQVAKVECEDLFTNPSVLGIEGETDSMRKITKFIKTKLTVLDLLKTDLSDRILKYSRNQNPLELRDICVYAETRYQMENAKAVKILDQIETFKIREAKGKKLEGVILKILIAIAAGFFILFFTLACFEYPRTR